MKRDVTPDMYNYNKYPGPKFEKLVDKVRSDDIELTLVDNYKEAFDVTAFEQRFTSFMLKFDYIVGDWGNEQLRLKGFYTDDKAPSQALKISRLEDYLQEFCNYGCAYFVLENPNPEAPEVEEDPQPRRRRRRRSRGAQKDRTPQTDTAQNPEIKPDRSTPSRRRRKPQTDKRHFEIKADQTKTVKEKAPKEKTTSKRDFVIRQK